MYFQLQCTPIANSYKNGEKGKSLKMSYDHNKNFVILVHDWMVGVTWPAGSTVIGRQSPEGVRPNANLGHKMI